MNAKLQTPNAERKKVSRKGAKAQRFRDERAALAYLRENNPSFFKNDTTAELCGFVAVELKEYMRGMSAVEVAGFLASVLSLMYRMGTAALKSIRDDKERGMAQLMVEEFRRESGVK